MLIVNSKAFSQKQTLLITTACMPRLAAVWEKLENRNYTSKILTGQA